MRRQPTYTWPVSAVSRTTSSSQPNRNGSMEKSNKPCGEHARKMLKNSILGYIQMYPIPIKATLSTKSRTQVATHKYSSSGRQGRRNDHRIRTEDGGVRSSQTCDQVSLRKPFLHHISQAARPKINLESQRTQPISQHKSGDRRCPKPRCWV